MKNEKIEGTFNSVLKTMKENKNNKIIAYREADLNKLKSFATTYYHVFSNKSLIKKLKEAVENNLI